MDESCFRIRVYELPQEQIEKLAREKSLLLQNQIFDPSRSGVRELASNPLLITQLAIIYRNKFDNLPENRIELYHAAIENLITVWEKDRIKKKELNYK